MPNTRLSSSLSLLPSLLLHLLSLSVAFSSFVVSLFLTKQNYNTLLFLTFIKSSFLLFLEKKTRHLPNFLVPLPGGIMRYIVYF